MAFLLHSKKVKATGVDDMVLISKLTPEEICENLKKRHANDLIYTYISDVLISVNPFKNIPGLCTPDQIETYKGKFKHELPPHIYALAESAYRRMANDHENQCIIISGESGAGKTEASKLIMQYIAAVSGKGQEVERIKRIILESNPLLEAFGNAKTVRNNNSSRFGKYFEIQFDRKGDPQGGRITNYLLEKSRVVYQTKNERNFHIFYQLCKGASEEEKEQFGVGDPSGFAYLNQSGCTDIENVDDAQEFQLTKNAMDAIEIPKNEQISILKLVAAILWLGNINFVEGANGKTEVEDKNTLDFAAHLLSIQSEVLKKALLYRVISSGGKRASTINVPQSPDQACTIRDALAKTLYDRMFSWLVGRVNHAMQSSLKDMTVIGVLDIFGFEIFDKNGFEQFCINYVNEKLQQIFIDLTLAQEELEYKNEGIQWQPIKYFNNKIVCELIEGTKPPGIFAVLDDTCHTTHSMESSKADEKFLQKTEMSINHPHFVSRGADFIVKHYAGQVSYDIDGFTDKNKDNVYITLIECMKSTNDGFISQFFKEDVSVQSGKKPTTAGFKIKQSCKSLVETLKKCSPHYIRCIKPNETKMPKEFDIKRVLHQVKYLGLLENIKVRRAGFAYRQVFDKFIERFDILSKKTWPEPWKGDPKEGCQVLLNDVGIENTQWQLGNTKIFLRSPETLFSLEEMKERKYHNSATLIARTYKSYKLKKYFLDLRANATSLLEEKKERRRISINRVFLGDYVNYLENAQLQEIMKAYRNEGGVVFADIFYQPIRKTFGGFRIEKIYALLTEQALYYIEKVKEKKQHIMKLKSRIPLSKLMGVSMSCLSDNYMIVHVADSEELFAECNNKTEFLCILNDQYKQLSGNNIARTFSNQLEYNVTAKGKKKKVIFNKDPSPNTKIANLVSYRSQWTVQISEGMPSNSKPKSLGKKHSNPVPKKNAVSSSPSVAKERKATHQTSKAPGLSVAMEEAPSSKLPSYVPDTSITKPRSQSKINVTENIPVASDPQSDPQPAKVKTQEAVSTSPVRQQRKVPPPPPKNNRPKCRALYDYDGTADDELTIKEGDIITIMEKDDSGWWSGTLNGKTGLFPGNYTEEI